MEVSQKPRARPALAAALALLSACAPGPDSGEAADASEAPPAPDALPAFEGDLSWPALPETWIVGPGTGVYVDSRDHVWVLHRPDPERLSDEDIAARQNPLVPGCCVPAPPLIEIDPEGNVVQAWGSIERAPDWPAMPHGVFVDHNDFVWVSTSIYHQVMKFTRDGRHLLTIGEFDRVEGSNSTEFLGGSADVYVDPERNELYVADGYDNSRVIVFDAETGGYRRHWGAYGNTPEDRPRGGGPGGRGGGQAPDPDAMPAQFSLPHGIAGSRDGLIYVADRGNSRIQVFTRDGEFLQEGRVRSGGSGAFDVAFSPDPAQRFLYVADGQQHKIWILERASLSVVGEFGSEGTGPTQFGRPHNMAADSRGNLYVAEADPGFRFQKLVFQGPPATN